MLRLQGAGLFNERLLAFERKYWPGGHAGLRLIPCSVGGVAVVGEVEDIVKGGSVSFSVKAVFMSSGLDPIDHLDRRTAGGRRYRAERGYGYDASE